MIKKIILANSFIAAALAAALLIYPSVRAGLNIQDAALRGPGIPKVDWRLMRQLSPRYAAWAQQRVALGKAASLSTNDISGTEWPLFGSVFYLWGIENLQTAWEAGDRTSAVEPKVYCKDAIIAASELVIDPKHASWVEQHWGTNYLHRENVFYRMLVMAALTSREKLLHDGAHLDLLRDQVETFAKELDDSKSGLLNDYPGECYPADVIAALACIRRADAILGTDHSQFIKRSLRAFVGPRSTRFKLPPYMAETETGAPISEPRGCATSYFCMMSPELWAGPAKTWFQTYEKSFWQHRLGFAGFREFPKDVPNTDWTIDVDAGPVVAGFGVAADAFGVGAARKNGRFDLAYPLSAEMLTTVWELPNGTLAMPRILSNLSDAPMLGEAAILWLLSVQPEKGFAVRTGGNISTFVYVVIVGALLFGIWRMVAAINAFSAALREPEPAVSAPRLQTFIWVGLIVGSVGVSCCGRPLPGFALLLAALLLPRTKKRTTDDIMTDPDKGSAQQVERAKA
ncbi:MAG: hypothetical protein ACLQU4_14565 [Limisphaerales bacterium]